MIYDIEISVMFQDELTWSRRKHMYRNYTNYMLQATVEITYTNTSYKQKYTLLLQGSAQVYEQCVGTNLTGSRVSESFYCTL